MNAHATMLARSDNPRLLRLFAVVVLVLLNSVVSYGGPETEALLSFKKSLGNPSALKNWNPQVSPCDRDRSNWVGVRCLNGMIWGLQLENMGLTGNVNIEALASLPDFRTLSLMNNKLDGPWPDVKRLGKLKALYLSNNAFSGPIPDDAFDGMGSLKRVFLSHNGFTGKIPTSLANLPKLMELRLEGNQFSGQIPEFHQQTLKTINVANNELRGPIPASLSKMNPNSFSGNPGLCGTPLDECTGSESAAPGTPKKSNLVHILKILVIVISVMLLLVLVSFASYILYLKRQQTSAERSASVSSSINASSKIVTVNGKEYAQPDIPEGTVGHPRKTDGRLNFLTDDVDKFDLQDLLRASAEILGSGNFGASYKAVVSAQALVVKRYRYMNNIGREEFHEHMRRLGRLRHPNLLPLAAYYYRKEERLLVTAYVDNGCLATHLHGNHSPEEQGLDWNTRLKIIKGTARGLAYLYKELPIMVPHGNLKSSNILLDENFEPLVTDYALRPVTNPEHAHRFMMAYKSPEYIQQGRTSNKTDIWCFGILILEILTGKFPENYLTQGYDSKSNLAAWVNSKVQEKKTSEVFDKEMPGTKDRKGEMINLLKIGLNCCEEDAERRPDVKELVEKIENIDQIEETEGNEEEWIDGNAITVVGSGDEFNSHNMDR